MPDENKRKYLFVAIDRTTRMVCVQLRESKAAKDARELLKFVKELKHTLMRYVDLYNNYLPQANLDYRTPAQVIYECYEKQPQLFSKYVRNRPECDRYGGSYNP